MKQTIRIKTSILFPTQSMGIKKAIQSWYSMD